MRTSFLSQLAALLVGACMFSGCGQKGPLYLPDAEQTTVEKTTSPPPAAPAEDQRRDKNDPKAR